MQYLRTHLPNLYRKVRVETPARLHMGFMDLNGELGRRFGSLGLTVDGLPTRVVAEKAHALSAHGPGAERTITYASQLVERLGITDAVHIHVDACVPEHIGLGSGTQLALAVGTAIDRLYDLKLGTRRIVRMFERGARSGIGIGAFTEGGFLVDGGRADENELPPITVRLEFPAQWRVLLIFDQRGQGLHGEHEVEAFRALPSFPPGLAAKCCRLVMMRVLPALAEAHLDRFGQGIGELQRMVGDYFAPVQGGRFTSPAVTEVLDWLKSRGITGIGQSSWGPTGFGVIGSESRANSLQREAERIFGKRLPVGFLVVRPCNHGSTVELVDEPGVFARGAATSPCSLRKL